MSRLSRIAMSVVVLAATASVSQAALLSYFANLDGPSEAPANASPGTGTASVVYDTVAHTLALNVTFSGLIGNTTNSHIHGPTAVALTGTAGVATTTPTFVGFPSGVTSGAFANVLDLTLASSYNPSFITANGGTTAGAEAALVAAIADGKAYWNIHSNVFPGGEIRGFLLPVPEPATLSLVAVSALLFRRRRR